MFNVYKNQLSRQTGSRNLTGPKNATHNMVYLYDKISDFCHQQLLRKMRRKISWMDGRTDRRTEVKQYNYDPILKGDLWPIYCLGLGLGHTLVTSFEKVRNGHRFENRTTI